MKNLQELYDAYITTQPSSEKIKTATTMMIHVCKVLNIPSQEEVTREYFAKIPDALEKYFVANPNKATIDKGIIAEMIGRVGPKKSLEGILEKLFADKDENVRQFALNSLEFYGYQKPEAVIPYIERYRKSNDPIMVTMSVYLTAKLACSSQYDHILQCMTEWYQKKEHEFVEAVVRRMLYLHKNGYCADKSITIDDIEKWSMKILGEKLEVLFKKNNIHEQKLSDL